MKRVRYPAAFKAEAVKQVTERGHGVVDAATLVEPSNASPQACRDRTLLHLNARPSSNLTIPISSWQSAWRLLQARQLLPEQRLLRVPFWQPLLSLLQAPRQVQVQLSVQHADHAVS
jgi:hypothetical protein